MSCCKLRKYRKPEPNWVQRRSDNLGRAGAFITDRSTQSVLLVQSYNNRWGVPKGHVEQGETLPETARRELKEETGILLPLDVFNSSFSRKVGKTLYYMIEMKRNDDYVPNIADLEEDITGLCWIHYSCLCTFIAEGKMVLNSDSRKLLESTLKETYSTTNDIHSSMYRRSRSDNNGTVSDTKESSVA